MAEVIRMPRLSDTMEEGVIVEWHKKVGDKVSPGDVLAEVETDKATMDLESFQEGYLLHIGVEKGSVPVEAIIAVIGDEGEDFEKLLKEAQAQGSNGQSEPKKEQATEESSNVKSEESSSAPAAESASDSGDDARVKASPLAKKMAADAGIDIKRLSGSGDHGRIVKKDVERAIEEGVPAAPASRPAIPSFSTDGPAYEDVTVSQMRKTIARRLGESKFTAPHFYLTIEVDMDEAVAARKQINEMIAPDKVSFNDMVIKTAAIALKQHPAVNASWLGDRIRYHNEVHVGVAVAVEDGLVVPVVRHANMKTLRMLNGEVKDLAGRARNKQLKLDEMQGNTFTISNLGMFGIEEFTAIINPPDACILAVGGIIKKPAVKNDQVVVSNRMKVTLSCDHRVVDGATGAQFLQTFKQLLESPVRLLA